MEYAFLFPRFKILSGAERLILRLAGAVSDQGHRVSVVCHQFHDSCRAILPASVQVLSSGVRLDLFSNRYINAIFDYLRNGRLLELIPSSCNVVCCFGPALTLAEKIRKKLAIPVLYFCYEPPRFLYTDRELIQKKLRIPGMISGSIFDLYQKRDQKLVNTVDGVLCNSEFGREQIQRVYGRDACVITHGLDPFRPAQKRNEIRSHFGFEPNDIVVTTVNYLHPRKRVDLFIQTVQAANQNNSRIKGLIVGEGPEKEMLIQQADKRIIRFAGFVPEEDLREYYQASDIYLHTGRLETLGLSVIEASGYGLPVVSVNEGGPLETIVDGVTGFLRKADAEELAKPILELALAPSLRKSMGESGIEHVRRKYRWEKGAGDFLNAVALTGAF